MRLDCLLNLLQNFAINLAFPLLRESVGFVRDASKRVLPLFMLQIIEPKLMLQ